MKITRLIILLAYTLQLFSCKPLPKIDGDAIAERFKASSWNLGSTSSVHTSKGNLNILTLELKGLDFKTQEVANSYLNFAFYFFISQIRYSDINNFDLYEVKFSGSKSNYFGKIEKEKAIKLKNAILMADDAIHNTTYFPLYAPDDSTIQYANRQLKSYSKALGDRLNHSFTGFSISTDSTTSLTSVKISFSDIFESDTLKYYFDSDGIEPQSLTLIVIPK